MVGSFSEFCEMPPSFNQLLENKVIIAVKNLCERLSLSSRRKKKDVFSIFGLLLII